MRQTKLGLTWIRKKTWLTLEPHIRLENSQKPCHSAHRLTDRNLFCNVSARSYPEFLKSVVGLWGEGGS